MPKILLGLSIALMLGSAVLGYLTKNKVDLMKADIADKTQTIQMRDATIAKQKSGLKEASDQIASTKAQNEQLTTDLQASKDEAAKAEAKAADLTDQIAKLNDQMKVIMSKTNPGNPGEDLATQIQGLQKQLTDAETQLKEAQQVRDSLQAKNQELDGKNKELQAYKDHREGQMAGASLEGQVLAYNPSWNFVVLSIGDHQGVTTNAELIVKRGGDQIAKVRVSSVNPNTAVADVIPGSVASGVTVQPGDQVIYSGS